MNILEKYHLTVGTKILPRVGERYLGIKYLDVHCTKRGSDNCALNFLGFFYQDDYQDLLAEINWCLAGQHNGGGAIARIV